MLVLRRHSSSSFMGRVSLLILLAVTSILMQGPVRQGNASPTSSISAKSPGAAQTAAQMKDFQFAPATISVKAGDTVTWTNNDTFTHNVAVDRGPEIFVSTELRPGQGTQITLNKPGSYHYFCEWHPFMQGSIEVAPSNNPPHVQSAPITFPETGKTVRGRFLDYWNTHGGLAQQGFPISEEMWEKSDVDGKVYTVQYFERGVFEFHSDNASPNDVLLSLLGNFLYKQKYPKGAPGQQPNTSAGSVLLRETGKRLGGAFLNYWNTHGGLAQQGYPISDEFSEKSDLDGKSYRVQYFERAVFEYHPENKAPYDVLLSQLGTFRLKAASALRYKPTAGVYPVGLSAGPEHYPLLAGPHAVAGVNAMIYDQDPAPVIGWVNDLGVKWVLHQLSWDHVEPQRDVYNWALIDPAVDALYNAGVKIILNPVHSPIWASFDTTPGYPKDPNDFARFMTQVAQRYKGKVAGYQIWNEPNLEVEAGAHASASRYAEILRASYLAVKAVDPNAVVISAALTATGINDPTVAVDDVVFLKRLYAYNNGEIKGYFDVLGAHPGSNANPPETLWPDNPGPGPGWTNHASFYFRRIEQLRQVMVDNGDAQKQMWLTEFGWTSTDHPTPGFEYAAQNTEQKQADYIARAFRMGRDRYPWMGPMIVFGLNFSLPNVAPDPTDERIGWSLLRRDGTQRPSYFAVKDYASGK
ncbi:MAG: plastocyanin/azurin family copper-binding protein [Chloroflexia bacterium]